ncbi:MAG: isoprenyl transferase [Syntrophomonadaceae bacterium]|nr:isoprenyl transferase [Syntrophomonadaceae bacterium]
MGVLLIVGRGELVANKKKTPDTTQLEGPIPRHIAIIMDGNGRWAQQRLLPRTLGHRAGMSALKKVVQSCDALKVPFLSVFALSTENWTRPENEIDYLMDLLVEFLHRELDELHRNNVQIHVLGDYEATPPKCQAEIRRALSMTRHNTGLVFNIALNYGSRREIVETVKSISERVLSGEVGPNDIDEQLFAQSLYTGGMPDPDLLIRTAGEKRISNFLFWQIAYADKVVSDVLWPEFTPDELHPAIKQFQGRDRRFGGLKK